MIICGGLKITSLKRKQRAVHKKVPKGRGDSRKNMPRIEGKFIEEITTAQISGFVSEIVRIKGLAPKTANHNIKILRRLFNWAMEEGGVKMPEDNNPAKKVKLYKEWDCQICLRKTATLTGRKGFHCQTDSYNNNSHDISF